MLFHEDMCPKAVSNQDSFLLILNTEKSFTLCPKGQYIFHIFLRRAVKVICASIRFNVKVQSSREKWLQLYMYLEVC